MRTVAYPRGTGENSRADPPQLRPRAQAGPRPADISLRHPHDIMSARRYNLPFPHAGGPPWGTPVMERRPSVEVALSFKTDHATYKDRADGSRPLGRETSGRPQQFVWSITTLSIRSGTWTKKPT